MDLTHTRNDSLPARLYRKRREILFALILTFAAAGYTLAAHLNASQKAPVALTGEPKKIH